MLENHEILSSDFKDKSDAFFKYRLIKNTVATVIMQKSIIDRILLFSFNFTLGLMVNCL